MPAFISLPAAGDKDGVRRTAERHDLGVNPTGGLFRAVSVSCFVIANVFRGFTGVADAGKDGCHTGNGAGGRAGGIPSCSSLV